MNSSLVKGFDESPGKMTIFLPDFSNKVVSSFVQFLYTGETLIDLKLRKEFISLCKEMMVNVPYLGTDVKEEQIDVNEVVEQFYEEEIEPSASDAIDHIEETDDREIINEYEASEMDDQLLEEIDEEIEIGHKSSNETHFLDSDNRHQRIRIILPTTLSSLNLKTDHDATNDDFERRNTVESLPRQARSAKLRNFQFPVSPQPTKYLTSVQKLSEAIADIQRGVRPMVAARKHGVPKTTLYRKLSQMKKE